MSSIKKMYFALIVLMLSDLVVCRPIDFNKVKDRSMIKWEVSSSSVFDKLQYVLCILATYFIFTLIKEQLIYSKLLKEMRILQKVTKHGQWQIDESNDEMNALISRLEKNRTTRIPNILQDLQQIYNKNDLRHEVGKKFADEIYTWKNTITANTGKLRTLNKALFNENEQPVTVKKIKRTGLYAAERINKMDENLHHQIVIVRNVLQNSSRLMDLKGLPMRCQNGNSHDL